MFRISLSVSGGSGSLNISQSENNLPVLSCGLEATPLSPIHLTDGRSCRARLFRHFSPQVGSQALLPLLLCLLTLASCTASKVKPWPPEMEERYPELQLFDESGQTVSLTEFQGDVLLIEPIRMGCPACQSFSGGFRWGAMGAVMPQGGIESIEALLGKYSQGLNTTSKGLQVLQIVFYDLNGNPPTPASIREWDSHFHLHERNILVLGARPVADGISAASLIPGFQLVDKKFVLRAEAKGTAAGDQLYGKLLPLIPHLLKE